MVSVFARSQEWCFSILAPVVLLFLLAYSMAHAGGRDKLILKTEAGEFSIYAEIADTEPARASGLMHRREMAADQGMLFIYDHDRIMHFWMKNTYLPFDLIFINRDGRISEFFENAVPHSLATMSSKKPARAVLELNAGSVKALSMRAGDIFLYPKLGWTGRKSGKRSKE